MVQTIELSITAPEGAAIPAIQMAPDNGGGFAQLLALLTDTVSNLDIPACEPAARNTGSKATSQVEPTVIAAAVLPISPVPVLPVPAQEFAQITPALLEGGRLGAGGTESYTPAPLPLLPINQEKTNEINYNFNQIYDIYKSNQNNIQENGKNIDFITSERWALAIGGKLEGVKEISLNLYFSCRNNDTPEKPVLVGRGDAMSEPVPFPMKRIEDAHQPKSAFDISPDRSLPFPAFQFATIDVSGDSPVESVTTRLLQLHEPIAQLVERLVLRREESAVHLRLDPPELGTVEIRIQVEGNAVHAWLAAERDLTRQSLEQQVQQLREQLASRGLQLAHFEVNTGSQEAFARARYAPLPSLPYSESRPRPQAAMESAYLFGQWSVWA
jgi:hypothetical protein